MIPYKPVTYEVIGASTPYLIAIETLPLPCKWQYAIASSGLREGLSIEKNWVGEGVDQGIPDFNVMEA